MDTLTLDERLHRLHVLMMDIEIAVEEGHTDIFNDCVKEAYQYITTDVSPKNSVRWD